MTAVVGSASTDAARIEPLARTDAGTYRDPYVEVSAVRGVRPRRSLHMVRTAHFDVTHEGTRVRLAHCVPEELVDDDLSSLLADELFTPGWLRGPELFERLFTGIVLTSTPDPLGSWTLFYRNTLSRVGAFLDAEPGDAGHGTIAGYAPVYAAAERLLAPGSVIELGCCFGFLSLRLAAAGRTVVASDVAPGTVGLLQRIAPVLGIGLQTRAADAARFPSIDGAADNVIAVHLLEHLEADHGDRVLAEAIRLARRRVLVAVPLEDVANETWGHVRTVSLADLAAWGRRTGLPFEVHEEHGGWLVLDTRRVR